MARMTPYGCIVVGTDGSALSDPTVARASFLAAAEEADLVIVCAYSGMTMREGAKATATLGDTRTSVVLGREAASDAFTGAATGVTRNVTAHSTSNESDESPNTSSMVKRRTRRS